VHLCTTNTRSLPYLTSADIPLSTLQFYFPFYATCEYLKKGKPEDYLSNLISASTTNHLHISYTCQLTTSPTFDVNLTEYRIIPHPPQQATSPTTFSRHDGFTHQRSHHLPRA
jgi:hypothetical protein